MTVQIALSTADLAPVGSVPDGSHEIVADISYLRLSIVNVVFFGLPGCGDRGWVLIDAGLSNSQRAISETSEKRFGRGARPAAILLTHGHFDHVGAAADLASEWDCPVYAHVLEHPYLNGSIAYPPADPWVGGGLVALLSPLFPRSPVNLGGRLQQLPLDGSVPGMPDWKWVHTPGHTPGHASFWRQMDRTIIAGDAFITTGQESAYEVAMQKPEMHGPPRYFTPDWQAAKASVQRLSNLEPDLAITGHGPPVAGPGMREALVRLAHDFDSVAVPK